MMVQMSPRTTAGLPSTRSAALMFTSLIRFPARNRSAVFAFDRKWGRRRTLPRSIGWKFKILHLYGIFAILCQSDRRHLAWWEICTPKKLIDTKQTRRSYNMKCRFLDYFQVVMVCIQFCRTLFYSMVINSNE